MRSMHRCPASGQTSTAPALSLRYTCTAQDPSCAGATERECERRHDGQVAWRRSPELALLAWVFGVAIATLNYGAGWLGYEAAKIDFSSAKAELARTLTSAAAPSAQLTIRTPSSSVRVSSASPQVSVTAAPLDLPHAVGWLISPAIFALYLKQRVLSPSGRRAASALPTGALAPVGAKRPESAPLREPARCPQAQEMTAHAQSTAREREQACPREDFRW